MLRILSLTLLTPLAFAQWYAQRVEPVRYNIRFTDVKALIADGQAANDAKGEYNFYLWVEKYADAELKRELLDLVRAYIPFKYEVSAPQLSYVFQVFGQASEKNFSIEYENVKLRLMIHYPGQNKASETVWESEPISGFGTLTQFKFLLLEQAKSGLISLDHSKLGAAHTEISIPGKFCVSGKWEAPKDGFLYLINNRLQIRLNQQDQWNQPRTLQTLQVEVGQSALLGPSPVLVISSELSQEKWFFQFADQPTAETVDKRQGLITGLMAKAE